MSNVKSFWCKVFFSDFVFHYIGMTNKEIIKDIKESMIALSKVSEEGSSFGASMVRNANERMASRAANASRNNGLNGGRPKSITATTPQPSPISTDGPRQAENAQAEAGAPSHGGSVANNSALDMPAKYDKASDQGASNTGITPPVVSLESGKFEHGDGNTADTASGRGPEPDKFHDQETASGNYQVPDKVSTNNCGADAVNGNATVDRKSATSAPLRPWKEVVEKSLGISETDKSGTGKGVRPPNPVPGLLKKRRAAGSPLKPGTGPSPAARSLPKSMAEVSDFACSENLDYDDCRLWWEQNFVERKGKDKEGKMITNWRGALIRFCESAKRKRESA